MKLKRRENEAGLSGMITNKTRQQFSTKFRRAI